MRESRVKKYCLELLLNIFVSLIATIATLKWIGSI